MTKKATEKVATNAPESDLLGTPLIDEDEFHRKLSHILAVPKEELQEHIATHPDPPQKRGRKPKTPQTPTAPK